MGMQAQTINGRLVDEQNQPLSYANVVLSLTVRYKFNKSKYKGTGAGQDAKARF